MCCCLLESRATVDDVYGSRSLDSTQSENGTLFIREMRQRRKPRTKVRPSIYKAVMRLSVRVQVAVGCGIKSTKSRHHEAKAMAQL